MSDPNSLTAAIKRLASPRARGNAALITPKARNPIVSPTGESAGVVGGGKANEGLIPPFVEDASQRAYWADIELTSSDGLFVVTLSPFKTRVFDDDGGNTVEYQYPDPGA